MRMVMTAKIDEIVSEFIGIHLLRYVCALAVVIYHYRHFFYFGYTPSIIYNLQEFPFFKWLKFFYIYGNSAVQIFWAISGFIFFWKYGAVIYKNIVSPRRFFILRLTRLYPIYFLMLIITAILQILYKLQIGGYFIYPKCNLYHFILSLFFISYWGFQHGLSFDGPTWSISVELFAYYIFLLAALTMELTLLSGIGFTLIFLLLFKYQLINIDFAQCLTLFFLGGVTFKVYQKIRLASAKTSSIMKLVVIAVLIGISPRIIGSWPTFIPPQLNLLSYIEYLIYVASLLLGCLFLLKLIKLSSFYQRLGRISNTTYSLYLVHFPIQLSIVLITDHLDISRMVYYSPYLFLIFVALSLTVAHYLSRYVEFPIQNVLRALLKD